MNKAEEYLKSHNIPNIKWTSYINSQGEVKEGMDFPYSISEVMEQFLKQEVNAISDDEIMQKRKEIVNEWKIAGLGFAVCAVEIFMKSIEWFKNKKLKQ